jgi:hypothetical protein
MTHNRESSIGGQQRVQRDTEAEKSAKKRKSRSPLAWKMKSCWPHKNLWLPGAIIQIEFYIEVE